MILGTLIAAHAVLAANAAGYVYWTNEQDGTIGRANPNGTSANQSFIKTGGEPTAVAVNGRHLFWAHRAADEGSIGRANLDGSGQNPNLIPFLEPSGVAANGTHLFWTEAIADNCDITLTNCFGYVGRANLDGTGADYDFIRPPGSTHGVAPTATHLYWAGQTGDAIGFIGRANLNGSGTVHKLINNLDGPSGPSVSSTHIYWADAFGPDIGRANLNGTGVNRSFITGEGPCATAVHAGHLYWTDVRRDTIGRANLDGSGVDRDFITGAKNPCGIAVDSLGQSGGADFSFGKVKRNKRKGTAKLPVNVQRAGGLALAKTKKVKGAQKRADAAGTVKLPIKPKRKAKKKLGKRGKAKVKAVVTYTADGGAATTKSTSVKLKKKRR